MYGKKVLNVKAGQDCTMEPLFLDQKENMNLVFSYKI